IYDKGFKEIKIGVLANNLLDFNYANNGYSWGYISGGKRIIENFYYPQAGRNFLVRLTLKM
ncbi:MAG: TonB-dependent receptor, partial [Crocinitomicaceae bacterium]|nr:TonB-dependent receptor [Crocinitomicaceae bacterium]